MPKPKHSSFDDRLVTGKPINVTAARVMRAGPVGLALEVPAASGYCEALPLPTVKPANPTMADISGRVFGSLTVIGPTERHNHSGKVLYLCRCVCGYYVLRTGRATDAARNPHDMCDRCRYLRQLKSKEAKRQKCLIGSLTQWTHAQKKTYKQLRGKNND